MKKRYMLIRSTILFLCSLLILWSMSCESTIDALGPNENIEMNLSVDEYPTSGNTLGTFSTTLSGTVGYILVTESVSGAFTINSGQLRVADWLVFDYESNPVITAIVEATNGTESQIINVEVTVNDVDDIWAFLGDSRTAYENAMDGDWVSVVESEYNDIANYLAEITKSGATDAHFADNSSITSRSGGVTIANDNGNTMPQGSYLIAFKYYSWSNNVVSSRVKISEGDEGGPHRHVGNVLPEHNDEYNFFVLKGADTPTASTGYLSMYASVSVGWKSITGTTYRWVNGDLENLDNSYIDAVFLHQGLSSTLKQWD